MIRLVLLRHGQSVWNREKRFTGWTDVGLSTRGVAEAQAAGALLRVSGYVFDVCFTSYLSRASETLKVILEEMGLLHVPIQRSWRLNERHYGALQGLRWQEAVREYGLKQVLVWQRHFAVRPPALDPTDARFPGHDPRYADLASTELPCTESLCDTLTRVLPYWHETILPTLRQGKRTLIVAHGNSLRSLRKYLENIPDALMPQVTVPRGEPLVYDLDEAARPLRCYYLRPSRGWRQWIQSPVGWWVQKIATQGQ